MKRRKIRMHAGRTSYGIVVRSAVLMILGGLAAVSLHAMASLARMPDDPLLANIVRRMPSSVPAVKRAPRKTSVRKVRPQSSSLSSSSSSAITENLEAYGKMGLYLTQGNVAKTEFFTAIADNLQATGGNALVFDVKGGHVFFDSFAPMARELGLVKKVYDLPDVLTRAKQRGIYTIARFVAIKDYGLTDALPKTRVRHPKTGHVLTSGWVDPGDETVIEYNAQIVCDLAAAGIDEINFDYIRFSGNDDTLHGMTGDEKADRLIPFLAAMKDMRDRCGAKTKLGVSTYAILGWDYKRNVETLGQDVIRYAPYVDVISPMAYPQTFADGYYYVPGKHPRSRMYYLVYRTLTGYQQMLGPEHAWKLRPWIQGYSIDAKDFKEEMDAVYDAGICGFTVWNANNNYKPVLQAMRESTTRPARCMDLSALKTTPMPSWFGPALNGSSSVASKKTQP